MGGSVASKLGQMGVNVVYEGLEGAMKPRAHIDDLKFKMVGADSFKRFHHGSEGFINELEKVNNKRAYIWWASWVGYNLMYGDYVLVELTCKNREDLLEKFKAIFAGSGNTFKRWFESISSDPTIKAEDLRRMTTTLRKQWEYKHYGVHYGLDCHHMITILRFELP